MKRGTILLAMAALAAAQQPAAPPANPMAAEAEEIRRGLAQANTSELEVIRFLESFLKQHPNTAYRAQAELRAAQAAIKINSDAQIVHWGELVLARTPDDPSMLTAVTRSLLALNTRDAAERALKYARHTEELVRQTQKDGSPSNMNPIEWQRASEQALGRALTDDARATAILGRPDEALATAQRAFDTYPNAESARTISAMFERLGKPAEAMLTLADAFTIPDVQATVDERAHDRAHLGQLYSKAKGSQEGLGELCLQAYDRNVALLQSRESGRYQNEPNAGRGSVAEFTLSGVDGAKLTIASLKGKVVVMDMWATWCIPCREQHPLYEQVKERFHDNPSVVFLSINSDTDHAPVKAFLSAQKWQGPVYYEDGLARAFQVPGLPATILLDRKGQLFTQINGYEKAHFVDLLTERIRQALAN
jgi:thiol-disulfide isomerase/thioredoxin